MMGQICNLRLHPLPTSPIKGEVSLHSFGTIQSPLPAVTSPLMGEARRGWSHILQNQPLSPKKPNQNKSLTPCIPRPR